MLRWGRSSLTHSSRRSPKSPIFVENTRVGQKTDYDRLILEIHTNGAITPEDALSYAAKLVKDHLQLFIHLDEQVMVEELPQEDEEILRIRGICSRPGSTNWNFPFVPRTASAPPIFRPWPIWSRRANRKC